VQSLNLLWFYCSIAPLASPGFFLCPVVGRQTRAAIPFPSAPWIIFCTFIIVLFGRAFICLFVCSLCPLMRPHQGKLRLLSVSWSFGCLLLFSLNGLPAANGIYYYFYTLNIVSISERGSSNSVSAFYISFHEVRDSWPRSV